MPVIHYHINGCDYHNDDVDLAVAAALLTVHRIGLNEDELLVLIKRLAVTPVAVNVRRSDLLSLSQCDDESARTFYARTKGKAAACAYAIECSRVECNQSVDFTDFIIKDVFISGLSDDEIKREVLGWSDLDQKSIEQTVEFVEAKEMASEAMNRGSTTASVSSYRKQHKQPHQRPPNPKSRRCKECKTEIESSVWSRCQKRMDERHFCSK